MTINNGTVSFYSKDDAIHADNILTLKGGSIDVKGSYEGLEGYNVIINGGDISVVSTDDGINATATSGVGIKFSGGKTYVYAGGDGLDSNSRTSYQGISFEGGEVIVLSTSGGNSNIDTERDIPILPERCLQYLLLILWSMRRLTARTTLQLRLERTSIPQKAQQYQCLLILVL